MGDTIWVDVQGRAKDDLPSDNSIMLRLGKELDEVAAKLGVSKLTTFYDYSTLEEEFGDFGESDANAAADAGDEAGARGTWFDPSDALAAVGAIRRHLLKQPNDLGFTPDASRSHWPADLMEELAHVQAVLDDASSRGKKFRFLIVP